MSLTQLMIQPASQPASLLYLTIYLKWIWILINFDMGAEIVNFYISEKSSGETA